MSVTSAASLLSATATATASAPTSTGSSIRVASQGGVIDGANPTHYNPKDPIPLFIIQASLIIIVCHIIHWPLSKIRQPRVIAEVVGGILLGPSVMGRIPGFRAAIFPAESVPFLTLVANLGLVLYLFLIGLETDVRFLISNWRVATSVALGGLTLPFALGCALAWGVYNQFLGDDGTRHIGFSVYMLFVGVAIAITAFPVLCRILTELKLLDTPVGVIVLSAGVANDVVGWILLALCVALVNAGNGLTALWILLACLGYMLLLLYAIRPALIWVLRRSDSIELGPSQSMIALILLLALASAFFTSIIGVHAIFGGFMVGLILPRDGGFNIKVTEKLEDLIGALFLPLYFTLSGLNTDLGLLDSGIAWAYVVAVTLVAFFTKLAGASVAARLNGLVWRESLTIGVLMSCKGLVELVVLNIGLQAEILSKRTFTIFVVMALLTTFSTTPLASWLYPPWYQKKLDAWKRGEIDWDTGAAIAGHDGPGDDVDSAKLASGRIGRLLVYLRLDNLPATLGLVSLFGITPETEASTHPEAREKGASGQDAPSLTPNDGAKSVKAHGLRLLQLTDRDSSFMTVSQVDEFSRGDPVVNIFRTVGQFLRVAVSGEVAVMPEGRFAEALVSKSADISSDLLLVPWSETGSLGDAQVPSSDGSADRFAPPYTSFVRTIFQATEHNIAVFFARPNGGAPAGSQTGEGAKLTRAYSFSDIHHDLPVTTVQNRSHHIFLPYLGGSDDKLALKLVLQLCEKKNVTATVVNFSETATVSGDDHFAFVSTHVPVRVAPRVKFEPATETGTAESVLDRAAIETSARATSKDTAWYPLVVLGRRAHAKLQAGRVSHKAAEEVQRCLGTTAAYFIASGTKTDLLVVQARESASQ